MVDGHTAKYGRVPECCLSTFLFIIHPLFILADTSDHVHPFHRFAVDDQGFELHNQQYKDGGHVEHRFQFFSARAGLDAGYGLILPGFVLFHGHQLLYPAGWQGNSRGKGNQEVRYEV